MAPARLRGALSALNQTEVFPLRARAAGMGASSVLLWAATGTVTAAFPIVSDDNHLGLGHTMWLFAGINVVLFAAVLRWAPETEGRSLEQIELDLRGGRSRAGVQAAVVEAEPVD